MRRRAALHRFPMTGPADVSLIDRAISNGEIVPGNIVAVLGKTEGNGCVNDFTRGYAVQSLRVLLERYLAPDQVNAIPLVMSGGTEGGLSPHWLVLQAGKDNPDSASQAHPALAFASTITRELDPSEIGRLPKSWLVRDAVCQAMADAGISQPSDVHFVQVKCPLLTAERVSSAGGDVSTQDTLRSMGLSRGASAIGVALALGEVDPARIGDTTIGNDLALWSSRASCSAGIELMTCEVVVLGLSNDWVGPLSIAHCVMMDAIDAPAIASMLHKAIPDTGLQQAAHRIHAVLAKAEAAKSGSIRGRRHVMLEDSDVSSTRHARSFVGGLLSGLIGHTELFVSGGAEHQGPDGGGPVAIIYSQEQ
jgi:cyanuric acid amidohydrolase